MPLVVMHQRHLSAMFETELAHLGAPIFEEFRFNAVAESFFSSLKKERIRKRIYKNRESATSDISDYIDSFYNPTRRHSHLGGLSPGEFEAAARRQTRVH